MSANPRRPKHRGAHFLSGDLTNDSLGFARLAGFELGQTPDDQNCCWVILATTSCTHTVRGTGEACCWIVVATTGCSTSQANCDDNDDDGSCGDESGNDC